MRRALWWVLLMLSACPREGVQKVRPQLQPPGDVIDFGTIPVLNEKTIEVELQSVGRAKLTVSNVSLATDDGIFTIVSAPASIEGGDVDKLVVKFVPQAEQTYENTLSFDSDDEDHPHLLVVLRKLDGHYLHAVIAALPVDRVDRVPGAFHRRAVEGPALGE